MANIALSLHEGGRTGAPDRQGAGRTLQAVPPWQQQFIGREELVEGARQALLSSAGAGVLLAGAAGAGKTTMARHLVETYFGHACVVQVRGSAATAAVPFGALGFLLAGVAGTELDHPVVALQEASRVLVEQAAGRKLLIVVENAHELDAMSATVLTQLARARMAKLIVCVAGFSGVAGQFARLWSGGELLRLDLENFTRGESARFIESLVGGPVSRAASDALWELTAGNPLFLRLLVLEQRRAGSLVQREGVWVLAGRMVHSGEIVDVVRSWLEAFTPRQRTVLELLAFAAELPLELLQDRGDAAALDELQELDAVEVCLSRPATVRLRQPLVAAVLRQMVQPGRSLELLTSVAGDSRLEALPPSAAVRLATWRLDCGQRLDRQEALAAAALANRLQDRTAALRFVRCVPDGGRDPECVLEEARALNALGDSLAAIQAIERVPLRPSTAGLVRTRLMLEHHRALRAMAESAAAADGLLHTLRESVRCPAAGTAAADLQAMGREVALAEAEQAAFSGRFAQLPAGLGDVFADRSLEPAERLGAGALLGAAHALTGRTAEAAAVAGQLESALAELQLLPVELGKLRGDLFLIYLAAGLWSRCAALLDDEVILFGAGSGISGELASGLLDTVCGRAEKARPALESAIAQLAVADPSGVLPLGLAAAAYACALNGDQARARGYLQTYTSTRQTGPWAVRAGSDYFRIAAEARMGRRGEAVAELNERAGHAAAGGLDGMVPLYLAEAARLGDLASAQRLAECAAGGRTLPAAAVLLELCELARNEGNNLFAHELADVVVRMASDEAGKRQARLVQRQVFRKLDSYRSTRRRIEELGDFERSLALAAGRGRTSAAMAKELHLSPRTVDWHLGKIYSRLQVSGRAELREVLN